MKRCFKCLCEKPLDAFYKHKRMADGHLGKCKECTKSDVAKNRAENLEQIRQYDRMRASMPHRISMRREIGSQWRSSYPNRKKAQTALRYAVLTGKVSPWPVCALPTCEQKPEAHHPDYDSPLDVVWLCRPHHMQAHAQSSTKDK